MSAVNVEPEEVIQPVQHQEFLGRSAWSPREIVYRAPEKLSVAVQKNARHGTLIPPLNLGGLRNKSPPSSPKRVTGLVAASEMMGKGLDPFVKQPIPPPPKKREPVYM